MFAVVLEFEPLPGKEDISFPGCCEIRDAVADEDDKWDFALVTESCGFSAALVDGQGFVVAEFCLVQPDGFPGGSVGADVGVVCHDVDMRGLHFC